MATEWARHVGENITRDSWSDCLQLLLSWGGDGALYRGQRCFDWGLASTLERNLPDYAERWDKDFAERMYSMAGDPETDSRARAIEIGLTQKFRQHAENYGIPDLPLAEDLLAWWELMQHHGAPTRLLDWSPLTAHCFVVCS